MKTADALPVRVVRDGEAVDAAAVREVDLLKKYHWTSSKIAEKLKLSTPRAAALREHLGIDQDEDCTYTVPHNSQQLTYYSDNAYKRMRDAMTEQDMSVIWESHSKIKRRAPRPACTVPGCAVRAT